MILTDIEKLANDSKRHYNSAFINQDIMLHKDFKEKFEKTLNEKGSSVKFLDYSAEIITSSKNKIFLPNQWFYIATFMVDFYLELIKYKQELEKILSNPNLINMDKKSIIKSLKEGNYSNIENQIKAAIHEHFQDSQENIDYMWKFLTDYEWWNGQKTIERHDFYVSPILKLLGLVNVSQSYVADIVVFFASDSELKREAEALINQLSLLSEFSSDTTEMHFPKEESDIVQANISKNLILNGPPGTGKTFETIEIALKICGYWTDDMHSNRRKAVETFKKLQDEARIEFVTFHQSMSYEEFIEGLSAEVHNNEVVYKVKDGIFKKVCKRASKNVFNQGDIISRYEIVSINKGLICVKSSTGSIAPIPLDLIEDIAKNVLNGQCTIDDIRRGENKENVSTLYDNFILGYKSILSTLVSYYIDNLDKATDDKPYVLIIDEINRANISKVFGDLITLIEEDKREGALNEIKVRLQYSQEYFSVPKNVFIIGTMNTADRSIALMDIALRRRFDFREIMPQTQILGSVSLNDDEINLAELLEVINKRITVLLDRNYSIGQALFIHVHDINQLVISIKNKLLPLLQEYFYGDWEKISLALGDNQKSDPSLKLIIKDSNYDLNNLFGKNTDFVNEDQVVYTVNPKLGMDEEKDFYLIKSIYTQES